MKVYIVTDIEDECAFKFVGVFASRGAAEHEIRYQVQFHKRSIYDFQIEEMEVRS